MARKRKHRLRKHVSLYFIVNYNFVFFVKVLTFREDKKTGVFFTLIKVVGSTLVVASVVVVYFVFVFVIFKIGTSRQNDLKSEQQDSGVQNGTVPRRSGQLACLVNNT